MRVHRVISTALIAAAMVLCIADAHARQFGRDGLRRAPRDDRPVFKGHSVTDFPHVRHLIEQAKALLTDVRDEAALKSLQEVIDRYPNQLYLADDGIYHGARHYCMELMSQFGDEQIAAYREAYDPRAEILFDEANAARDVAGLQEVVRRFAYTSFGPLALEQLGRIHHERGEFREALDYFKTSIDPRFGDEPTAERLVRIAHCLAAIGARDELLAIREQIANLGPAATVRFAGREQSAMSRYDVILDGATEITPSWSGSWPQFGGSADHEPQVEGYEGPLSQSLRVPLDFDALDPYSLTRSHRYLMSRYLPDPEELYPPFHPVVNESIAYVHDGLRLEAINLINGKRKWYHEAEPNPVAVPHPRMIFGSAMAEGVVYAALETEVFARTLAYKLTPIKLPMPQRKLRAFDAETGDVLWSHAAPDEDDPATLDFLERASASTPPVSWRENLYVGVSYFEGKIHSYVCCFDRRTGKLKWRTLVCTGQQELNMFGNQFMEYVASPMIIDDGMLYFTTNLGLVAAIEARTGLLHWINDYPIIPLPHPQHFHPRTRELSWYANPPYIHEGTLLTTPLDSDALLAFDTATGDLDWTHPRRTRNGWDSIFSLGVVDGNLILAGDEVLALDLETQDIAWRTNFDVPHERAEGLGVIADNRIYCPTRFGLYEIDAATGARKSTPVPWESSDAAGNLISFRNLFLTTSTHALSIYFRWDEISKRLLEELGKHPDAIEIHLKLGDGYAHAGKLSPALEHYRKALELSESNPGSPIAYEIRAKNGLYRVHTTLGRRAWERGNLEIAADFYSNALVYALDDESRIEGYRNFEELYRASKDTEKLRAHYETMLADIPRIRYEFELSREEISTGLYALLRLAELEMKERDGAGAVSCYQRILAEFPSERIDESTSSSYAKDHIDFLIQTFGREVYAEFEQEAKDLFEEAKDTRDVRLFEILLELYPNSAHIQNSLLEFSAVLQDRGDYARVLQILRGFLERFPGSPLRHRVLTQIGAAYETLGYADAAAYVSRLRDGGPGFETKSNPVGSMRLETPVTELWKKPFTGEGTLAFVKIRGDSTPFFREHLLLSGDDSLLCLRVANGETVWRRSDVRLTGDYETYLEDDRLYFSTVDDEVMCLDPETGSTVWVRDFEHRIIDTVGAPGTILTSIRGTNKNSFVLHAIDILTGTTVWSQHVTGILQKPMLAANGTLYVRVGSRSRPSRVLAIESFTGAENWEFHVEPNLKPIPFDARRILTPLAKETVAMRDTATRSDLWDYTRSQEWIRAFYELGDHVAVLLENRLVILDAETGLPSWERVLEEGNKIEWIAGMEESADDLLFLKLRRTDDNPENNLIALRLDDGSVAWEQALPPNPIFVKRLLRAGSTLVVQVTQYQADPRVQILLFDAESGDALQQIEYADHYYAEVKLQDGHLCIITGNKLHLLQRGQR